MTSRAPGPFPLTATAPFVAVGGIVQVRNADGLVQCKSGLTYMCRSSTGTIRLRLPPKGYVNVVDADGTAATSNITVSVPRGHTIMDGAVNEDFAIDIAYFGCLISRVPTRTNWSVS